MDPSDVLIVVPLLGRPHRVRPLLESVAATSVESRVLLVISAHDTGTAMAVQAALNIVPKLSMLAIGYTNIGDYAKKINAAFLITDEPFLFLGADDLKFHPGWCEAALARMEDPKIGVVGTQDMGNPRVLAGEHSTHSLVRRAYVYEPGAVIGQPGAVLNPDYPHEWVDDELVRTAMFHRAWDFAEDSIVEHLHPNWDKAPTDAIYDESLERSRVGERLFYHRRHLWGE